MKDRFEDITAIFGSLPGWDLGLSSWDPCTAWLVVLTKPRCEALPLSLEPPRTVSCWFL